MSFGHQGDRRVDGFDFRFFALTALRIRVSGWRVYVWYWSRKILQMWRRRCPSRLAHRRQNAGVLCWEDAVMVVRLVQAQRCKITILADLGWLSCSAAIRSSAWRLKAGMHCIGPWVDLMRRIGPQAGVAGLRCLRLCVLRRCRETTLSGLSTRVSGSGFVPGKAAGMGAMRWVCFGKWGAL